MPLPATPTLTLVLRFAAGLALLVALSVAGEWLVRVAHVPVPGSVVGMVVLTVLIEVGAIPVDLVRPAADLLVRHLALLFVPAGAALVVHMAAVRADLGAIAAAALTSLVAVLLVIGVLVQRLGRDA